MFRILERSKMIPLSGYAKAKKYVDTHIKQTESEILQFKKKHPGPCLTISRQSGIDIHPICRKLVDKLSFHYGTEWAYFDKDLLRKVLNDHNLPQHVIKFLNEDKPSTFNQMLNELLGIHPPILKLTHKMINTIKNLAEIGNVILIGRGANIITFYLNNSFHIRLVAPFESRLKYLIERKKLSKDLAKKILTKEDDVRKKYFYQTFRKDINDPTLYHKIINVSLFKEEELVEDLIHNIIARFPQAIYSHHSLKQQIKI
jgi:hypothetical protein